MKKLVLKAIEPMKAIKPKVGDADGFETHELTLETETTPKLVVVIRDNNADEATVASLKKHFPEGTLVVAMGPDTTFEIFEISE